jgi:hemoglobin
MEASKQHAFEFFAAGTGGPFEYTGKDLRTTHSGMNISEQEFLAVVDDVVGQRRRGKQPPRAIGPIRA